jgi:DNA segregation ATPase FtsK/SpoIIIE-like protein
MSVPIIQGYSPLHRTLFAPSVVVLPGHALQVGLADSSPPAEMDPAAHTLQAGGVEPDTSSLPARQAAKAAPAEQQRQQQQKQKQQQQKQQQQQQETRCYAAARDKTLLQQVTSYKSYASEARLWPA